ncbi:MAG: DUF2889 domain-containing protein [Nocardioidaceae bacterium]
MSPQPGVQVTRSKSLTTTPTHTEGLLAFESSLRDVATFAHADEARSDVVHHITITGVVDIATWTLSDVTPHAYVLPYEDCGTAMARVIHLSGLSIGRGYRAAVLELMGRTRGCTHFMSLSLELAQLHTLGTYTTLRTKMPDGDRTRPEWLASEPQLENACYSLRSDSPVIQQSIAVRRQHEGPGSGA